MYKRQPNIDKEQYKRFKDAYDHLLYILFVHNPDASKESRLRQEYGITTFLLPRTIFYIPAASGDIATFADAINAILSEDNKIREAIIELLRKSLDTEAVMEGAKKGMERLVEVIVEIIKKEKLVQKAESNKTRKATKSLNVLYNKYRRLLGIPEEEFKRTMYNEKVLKEIEKRIGKKISVANDKLIVFA